MELFWTAMVAAVSILRIAIHYKYPARYGKSGYVPPSDQPGLEIRLLEHCIHPVGLDQVIAQRPDLVQGQLATRVRVEHGGAHR